MRAAIIGAGELGGAVARTLAMREVVHRIVLIDRAGAAAAGKALDLQQAGAIAGVRTRLEGSDELARAAGCDICILADAFGGRPGGDDADALHELLTLARFNPTAPLVLAGIAHDRLLAPASKEGGISQDRLIGSCPEGLASAIRALVALEAGCAPGEVVVRVLGVPPVFVVGWGDASIRGSAMHDVLSPPQMARLEAKVQHLWPLDAQALGSAAAVVAEGALRSARRSFSVLTLLDGEFGLRETPGTVQVRLTPRGIQDRLAPPLSARDRTRLQIALGS